MSERHVKKLIEQAAEAANDNEGTVSMKLTQAALNATQAMLNLETLRRR